MLSLRGGLRGLHGARTVLCEKFGARMHATGHDRAAIRGTMREMEHLRGGLGGVAPMHLNVDSRVIHGFRWVPCDDLFEHEAVREDKADALKVYIDTQA